MSTGIRNARLAMRPMSANTGMEVTGIDLREPLSEQAYLELRHALNETGVICFRDQELEPAHQLAFAQYFGTPVNAEFLKTVPGFPTVAEVRKEPEETRNVGGNWHADHTFDPLPYLGSVLYAKELPERGGDTMFANMAAAYDSLSDGLKETLGGLRAVHQKKHAFSADQRPDRQVSAEKRARYAEDYANRETVHPAVVRHPDTGRRLLYVNPTYTVRFEGWTAEESAPQLHTLYAHATRPENTCRFNWRSGSVAFWDNRTAMHYALNDYHGERRLMHRIVLEGAPFPA